MPSQRQVDIPSFYTKATDLLITCQQRRLEAVLRFLQKRRLQPETAVAGLDLINAKHNHRTYPAWPLRPRRVNQTNARPGKLTDTGGIIAAGQAITAVNVSFKRHEAQRLAETVLAYLRAWDMVRMLIHQEWVSLLPRYLLVPTSRETNGAATAVSPSPSGNGQQGNGNGRPVACHDSPTPTANGNGWAGQLVYGDGTAVDPGNQKEAATYRRYLAAKQAAPASKAALLAYYRAAVG